jgi:hypothetical protein
MRIDIPEIADIQIIKTFGGRKLAASTWETITESQPPKQIVSKRIILPLMEAELARKHAVVPPRTIFFSALRAQAKPILCRPSPVSCNKTIFNHYLREPLNPAVYAGGHGISVQQGPAGGL